MGTTTRYALAAAIIGAALLGAGAARADGFAGAWSTTYGPMTLTAAGAHVTGTYVFEGAVGRIDGTVSGARLAFHYIEPQARGEGWFDLAGDGRSFSGKWREEGDKPWRGWSGSRDASETVAATFDGLWDSSYGRLRLMVNGADARGIYAFGDGASLEGKVSGRRLAFRYTEPEARGEGWFDLAPDGRTFRGEWHADGATAAREWTGQRVVAEPGRTWLVILEAYWERGLSDPPYAFGEMLESYFRRVPSVGVRRRAFSDEEDLRRWGRELAFLAEPVVVVVSTHADERGLSVRGRTIAAPAIAEALRFGRTIALLHFSACAIMKDNVARDVLAALAPARFPVSGYTTSVDWGESAITDITYLELVLARGMAPAAAADLLVRLIPIAGEAGVAGAPWAPAGFRIVR